MQPSVKKVTPLENFQLSVEFSNGEHGTLDMQPYLDFGVFKRLNELGAFQQVFVSFDTIEWQCGVDLDPEFVYSKCQRTDAQPKLTANS
ncbi:DUF2442 domain-containing protein [Alkalimonas sp. NCh-2]|uniref:DUF2442 domain-containing protein n=1 Tax=Alkalimonas sp. NCh-2 TaxID=3144846 RepID=UPI0031F6984D